MFIKIRKVKKINMKISCGVIKSEGEWYVLIYIYRDINKRTE
jgi:hypothetical protein